jgi:thymidylate synthase
VHLRIADLRGDYARVLQEVRYHGERVVVRDQPTLELLDVTLEIVDPTDTLPFGTGRGISPRIAALEALQLVGGVSCPELMVKASRNFDQFRDGGIYHGAYGPRLRAQLPVVVERLKLDPQTRQAVVTVWDPLHDLMVSDSRDYPCTVMLQFLVRDGRLQLHTTMRSNDVWWGLAYDAFQFTQLQLTVANVLGLPAGHYYHHAVSLHLYERDLAAVDKVDHGDRSLPLAHRPLGITGETMYEAMTVARHLLSGKQFGEPGTGWYEQALKPLWRE